MPKKSVLYYELYDLTAGGLLDDFEYINDAYKHLSDSVDSHGWNSLDDLSLIMVLDGDRSLIAKAAALAVETYQWRMQRRGVQTSTTSLGSATVKVEIRNV